MKKYIFIFMAAMAVGCGHANYKNPHVLIVTTFGEIEAELFPDKAPKSVAAFLSYVDSGFYTNSSFYRVVMQEGVNTAGNTGIVQGGIYQTNDKQHPGLPGLPHESTRQSGLSHTNGTLSLARTTPGTANTEFFICIGDQSQLDFGNLNGNDTLGFAAFGKVTSGMDIVRKIQQEPRNDQHFTEKITIRKIERL